MKCLYPIAEHDVYRYVMPEIGSNMYLLLHGAAALAVDPHICAEAEAMLQTAGVRSCTILLTHEHFDHISGVNRFRELFDCRVICSKACGNRIADPKKNLAASFPALFVDRDAASRRRMEARIDTGYRCEADSVYEDEMKITWNGTTVFLKEMPGHSPGSQIIRIGRRAIFTGDNYIPGEKTITRLPGGSRRVYQSVVAPYLQSLPAGSVLYPGHGEPEEKVT